MNLRLPVFVLCLGLWSTGVLAAEPTDAADPAPTSKDWAALGALPDWSGVWVPDVVDQNQQAKSNPPPWNSKAGQEALDLAAAEKAGHPKGLFVDCLPNGMPALMLVTHNPIEFVFSPGRVLVLGESDGDRQRRIYTDGRDHPSDPDPTFYGHSTGRWEGDTLAVDTVAVLPETYLAVSEAVGIPNDGDLHIVERLHLTGPDTLSDELTITAPHILTAPWKTGRLFYRRRARVDEITEGVCLQGKFAEGVDDHGDAAFVPIQYAADGSPLPPKP